MFLVQLVVHCTQNKIINFSQRSILKQFKITTNFSPGIFIKLFKIELMFLSYLDETFPTIRTCCFLGEDLAHQ